MKSFDQNNRFGRISRRLAAVALLTFSAPFADAALHRTVASPSGDGPHAVLVAPRPGHPGSISVAKQVETVALASGRLTLVELERAETAENLPEFFGEVGFTGDGRPDWLWIHRSVLNDSLKEPVVRVSVGAGDGFAADLEALFEGKVKVEVGGIPDPLTSLAKRGVVTIEHPEKSRESRRARHTRLLALELLRQTEMIGTDQRFEWQNLKNQNETLVALYDAEGIGGSGPDNLERIVSSRMGAASVYRVCGEDIREGALAPAATVIFPGGSGGGIGRALEATGREMVRDYVMGGGGYLGVCAGAYFAASGLDVYLHGIDLMHSQPWRRGRDVVEIELTPEGEELFGGERTVLTTRYANGPIFLPEDQGGDGDPEFRVLATFKTPSTDREGTVREEMVGQAAIGARQYGQGRMLIVSPHPESHEEHYDFVARGISWTMGMD